MTRERLAELIEAAGVEQKDLAGATGYSDAAISRWLSGSRKTMPEDFKVKAETFLIEKARDRMRFIRQTAGVNGHH